MKNNISKKLIVVTAIFFVVIIAASFSSRSIPVVPAANPISGCALTAEEFNSWFNSGSVTLNGIVKPFKSLGFLEPNKLPPDCNFLKWSEQTFLWLTSLVSEKRRTATPITPLSNTITDRIFDSPAFYDVSPPDAEGNRTFIPHEQGKIRVFSIRDAQTGPNKLPVTFEKKTGRLVEIEKTALSAKGLPMILNTANAETEVVTITMDNGMRPVFKDNRGKVIQNPRPLIRKKTDAKSIVQQFAIGNKFIYLDADGNNIDVELGQADGGDVLMSQNNSLVYYSISVNQLYAYFLTGMKNGYLEEDIESGKVIGNFFPTYAYNKILQLAATHGKTIEFPEAATIEIKCSWVEAASLPDASKYIKMKAIIPTYDKTNASQWIPNGQKTVELAMVGMHIVGKVAWWPDMLWATFEHINNTPNAAYNYSKSIAGSATGMAITVPLNTSGQWTFCADASTGTFNVARMHAEGNKIVANPDFTIDPSNIIRWKPWGTGGTDAATNNNLITLNKTVREMLMDGDVRKNYIQIGTTWKNPDNFQEKGSTRLANSTMETFMQGTNNSITTGTTCFSCHGPNGDDKKAYSHIYYSLKPLFKP
jgi:hypothetical protein